MSVYWIADVDGVKACVTDAEEREIWTRVHGWRATTEPTGQERQWVRNVDHGGRGVLNHEAALLHEGLGWVPSDPPPLPVTRADLASVATPAADSDPAAAAPAARPVLSATSGNDKE